MAYRPVQTPQNETAAPWSKPPRGSPGGRHVADSIAVGSAVGALTLSVLPSNAHARRFLFFAFLASDMRLEPLHALQVEAKSLLESQEERMAELLVGVEDTIRLLDVAADAESDAGQKAHFRVILLFFTLVPFNCSERSPSFT
jgi:hypothetical protein